MKRSAIVVLMALVVGPVASLAPPARMSYTTIAQDGMADPNRPGSTLNIFGAGQIDEGFVSFQANSESSAGGLDFEYYAGDGGPITRLAPVGTDIGVCSLGFSSLGGAWMDAGRFAFGADLFLGGPCMGIHLRDAGGNYTTLVDTTTTVPATSGVFTMFGELSLSGATLAFEGFGPGSNEVGLYIIDVDGSGITRIVGNDTSLAGCAAASIRQVAASSNGVAFIAYDADGPASCGGVYLWTGTSSIAVVASSKTLPFSDVAFSEELFKSVSYDGTTVAFAGERGVFTWRAGSGLEVIADLTTAIPGTSMTFLSFSSVSVDGAAVLFEGRQPYQPAVPLSGAYVARFGQMLPVAVPGQRLGGQPVDQVFVAENALDGNEVAFVAFYPSNPTPVVFKAVLPPVPIDVGVAAVQTSGRVSLRNCPVPCPRDVTIKVKNYGSLAVQATIRVDSTNPGLAMPIGCGTALTPLLTPLLVPGATYSAGCTVEYGSSGNYTLTAVTAPSLNGVPQPDGNAANNSQSAAVRVVP